MKQLTNRPPIVHLPNCIARHQPDAFLYAHSVECDKKLADWYEHADIPEDRKKHRYCRHLCMEEHTPEELIQIKDQYGHPPFRHVCITEVSPEEYKQWKAENQKYQYKRG